MRNTLPKNALEQQMTAYLTTLCSIAEGDTFLALRIAELIEEFLRNEFAPILKTRAADDFTAAAEDRALIGKLEQAGKNVTLNEVIPNMPDTFHDIDWGALILIGHTLRSRPPEGIADAKLNPVLLSSMAGAFFTECFVQAAPARYKTSCEGFVHWIANMFFRADKKSTLAIWEAAGRRPSSAEKQRQDLRDMLRIKSCIRRAHLSSARFDQVVLIPDRWPTWWYIEQPKLWGETLACRRHGEWLIKEIFSTVTGERVQIQSVDRTHTAFDLVGSMQFLPEYETFELVKTGRCKETHFVSVTRDNMIVLKLSDQEGRATLSYDEYLQQILELIRVGRLDPNTYDQILAEYPT